MCNKCINILKNKSDKRSWEEQKNDWDITLTEKGDVYYYRDGKIINSNNCTDCKNCICGHGIDKLFYVYNKVTNKTYVMGCICIVNYKSKDSKEGRGIFNGNVCIENKLKVIQRKKCDACNKMVLNFEQHKKSEKHKKNQLIYELEKKYRKCIRCQLYCIDINKPINYKYCINCFKKNNEEYKKRMEKRKN